MTYASESSTDSLLVGIAVSRVLTLLLSAKNLARVFHDLGDILNALFNVRNIQALLSGFQAALAVHGRIVIGGSLNYAFEVIDHLLYENQHQL